MSWFAPEPSSFGWCPFAKIAHQPCPLCGGSRAIVDILSGHIDSAWNHNAALVVITPIALTWFLKNLHQGDFKWGEIQKTLENSLRIHSLQGLFIGALWWAWNFARFT